MGSQELDTTEQLNHYYLLSLYFCSLVAQLYLTLSRLHELKPTRLLCPWCFPDKNTRVGCHFLLQGIFSTQGSKPCLLHQQVNSLPLSTWEAPLYTDHTVKTSQFYLESLSVDCWVKQRGSSQNPSDHCCYISDLCLILCETLEHQAGGKDPADTSLAKRFE